LSQLLYFIDELLEAKLFKSLVFHLQLKQNDTTNLLILFYKKNEKQHYVGEILAYQQ
jgi:hypothetical protein